MDVCAYTYEDAYLKKNTRTENRHTHTHTHTHTHIYIYIYIHIFLSSSCRAISTDIPDPLSPPFPIVHCFRYVFRATSCIGTKLLYVCSSWSSCLCSSMWRGLQEYITYELVPTSPTVSCMSDSSNFDSFRDGWYVVVQLLLCEFLPPGLVQYCLQHSCVFSLYVLSASMLCIHIAVSTRPQLIGQV